MDEFVEILKSPLSPPTVAGLLRQIVSNAHGVFELDSTNILWVIGLLKWSQKFTISRSVSKIPISTSWRSYRGSTFDGFASSKIDLCWKTLFSACAWCIGESADKTTNAAVKKILSFGNSKSLSLGFFLMLIKDVTILAMCRTLVDWSQK